MRAILGTIALEPNRWTAFKEPRMDLIELVPAIRRAGFNQLEIWQNHVSLRSLAAIRALRAKGDEVGMTFPYIGVYPIFTAGGLEAREQERIQADILDKAEILGTHRLKIMLACGLRGGEATPDQLRQVAERFGNWYREAKSRGIQMAVELHGGTVFDPVEAGERFMQAHPELDFTICYQPYDFQDTAKAMRQRFTLNRLTTDPAYNMMVGTFYARSVLTKFNNSYLMTFAAYNAGPNRAQEWAEKYGDPRQPGVDPLIWIESIPFRETRGYVQRVSEGIEVYRHRLRSTGQKIPDEQLTASGWCPVSCW